MSTFAQRPKAAQQTSSDKSLIPGRIHFGQTREVNSIHHLQRAIGKQAEQRLLEGNTRDVKGDITTATTAHLGWDFSRIPVLSHDQMGQSHPPFQFIQPKLTVGKADDPLEREADRIADDISSLKDSSMFILGAQEPVRPRKVMNQGKEARTLQTVQSSPRDVDNVLPFELGSLKAGGVPLPQPQRTYVESMFGYDFNTIRIHSGSHAAELANRINARAFTFGRDIVFGAGQYSPETETGTRLMAHELVHVVQQQTLPTFIQRQPQPGYFDRGGVEEQLDILLEGEGLPLKLYRQPDIQKLSFSEKTQLSFQRKWDAIIKLGDSRHKNAVLTLIKIVENKLYIAPNGFDAHQKSILQRVAVVALGKIGTPEAINKLTDLLNSKDPNERLLGASGFSEASGKPMPYWNVTPTSQLGTTLLTRLHQEKDHDVKSKVVVALGNVGSLSSKGEKQAIVPDLIHIMDSTPDTDIIHGDAIRALGKIGLDSATDPLLKQLIRHVNDLLAQDIIIALGNIGDVKAVDHLVIYLEKHQKPRVRIEAATALGKIRTQKAMKALMRRQAQETDDTVKAAIMKAIQNP